MNEIQESIKKNLPVILSNKTLSKEDGEMFALGVAQLTSAKNIKLLDGTLKAWERCLVQDIEKGLFTFEEFLGSLDANIRRDAYNRLDYSQLYKEAIIISYNNYTKDKKLIYCPVCKIKHIKYRVLEGYLPEEYDCFKNKWNEEDSKEMKSNLAVLEKLKKEYKDLT